MGGASKPRQSLRSPPHLKSHARPPVHPVKVQEPADSARCLVSAKRPIHPPFPSASTSPERKRDEADAGKRGVVEPIETRRAEASHPQTRDCGAWSFLASTSLRPARFRSPTSVQQRSTDRRFRASIWQVVVFAPRLTRRQRRGTCSPCRRLLWGVSNDYCDLAYEIDERKAPGNRELIRGNSRQVGVAGILVACRLNTTDDSSGGSEVLIWAIFGGAEKRASRRKCPSINSNFIVYGVCRTETRRCGFAMSAPPRASDSLDLATSPHLAPHSPFLFCFAFEPLGGATHSARFPAPTWGCHAPARRTSHSSTFRISGTLHR